MNNQQVEVASLIEIARALQITGSVIERLAKALCVGRREAHCSFASSTSGKPCERRVDAMKMDCAFGAYKLMPARKVASLA